MKRTSLAAVVLICSTLPGCSSVIPAPIDESTVALVGTPTYFNCTLSTKPSEPPDWYHYSVRAKPFQKNFIYAHRQFYPLYRKGFWLEKDASSGMHSLVIQSVDVGDAGRYECRDSKHTKIRIWWELIVLESTPICDSNIRPDGVIGSNSCDIEPEKLELSCTVPFHGNIPPAMTWKRSGDYRPITKYLTKATLERRVSYNLAITADHYLDGTIFICQTTQSRTSQYGCSTFKINVMHVFSNDSIVQQATGNNVTCYANSSQYCKYTWSKENGFEENKGQVLTSTIPGWYVCKAHCKMRDICCTVQAMALYLISDNPSLRDKLPVILTVLVIAIVFVILIFMLLIYCVKRNKKTTYTCNGDSRDGTSSFEMEEDEQAEAFKHAVGNRMLN